MRRPLQILCMAAAAIAAGGTLWAIAGSDMLGRYIQSYSPVPEAPPSAGQEKVPAVAALPRTPDAGATTRSREELAIEIARIEAGGASVLAGRSPPKHRVTVLANGREIATAVASEEGQWSIVLDGGIAAGPLELSVKSSAESGGPVVVGAPRQLVVPERRAGEARVAAGPAAKIAPPVAVAPRAAPAPQVVSAPPPSQSPATRSAVASPPSMRAPAPPPSTKGEEAVERRALEKFAALVERARSEAAEASRQAATAAKPSEVATTSRAAAATAPPIAVSRSSPVTAAPPVSVGSRPANPTTIAAAIPPAQQPPTATEVVRPASADPAPIPVPITFVTDETTLTENGSKAAALLAEYLRIKRPAGISLSGHADTRGPDRYNMELSRRRLEAIERYLRAAGYTGGLTLLPKGEREPYQGIDRKRLSLMEIYQADRRVELRLTQ